MTKPIKLTKPQLKVLEIVCCSATEVRLWRSELRPAERLYTLGLIARNTLHANLVKATAEGREAWAAIQRAA